MKNTLIALSLLVIAAPSWAATCKISEYEFMVQDSANSEVPVAREPAIAVQNVTYTTSTQSTALNARTRFVRVVCDAKAHFEFGVNPTAAATDPYLPADAPEYFGVEVNSSLEIAFYDGSS